MLARVHGKYKLSTHRDAMPYYPLTSPSLIVNMMLSSAKTAAIYKSRGVHQAAWVGYHTGGVHQAAWVGYHTGGVHQAAWVGYHTGGVHQAAWVGYHTGGVHQAAWVGYHREQVFLARKRKLIEEILTGIVPPDKAFPRTTMSGLTLSWSQANLLQNRTILI